MNPRLQSTIGTARAFLRKARGFRREKTVDLFSRCRYLPPETIRVSNYLRPHPLAAFNPGAVLANDEVHLFPRLVFDYYSYASAIGYARVPLNELITGRGPERLEVKIVLYPDERFEAVRGCEDARAHPHGSGFRLFYTGVGKVGKTLQDPSKDVFTASLAFTELSPELKVVRKGRVQLSGLPEEIATKNATFIAEDAILLRPSLPGVPDLGWRGRLDLETLEVHGLAPVLAPESFEYKVGWSTNAVMLKDGTLLVGYHGVLRRDLSYRHGLARLDGKGRLLAISDYLLAPKGLNERYGDRPLTLYGTGLAIAGDRLLWFGGVADYAMGVFCAPLERVLAALHPLG